MNHQADEPGALVEFSRLEHRPNSDWLVDVPCISCRNPWPCLTARLAEALLQAQHATEHAHSTWSDEYAKESAKLNGWLRTASEEREAARAEAAALRQVVWDEADYCDGEAALMVCDAGNFDDASVQVCDHCQMFRRAQGLRAALHPPEELKRATP